MVFLIVDHPSASRPQKHQIVKDSLRSGDLHVFRTPWTPSSLYIASPRMRVSRRDVSGRQSPNKGVASMHSSAMREHVSIKLNQEVVRRCPPRLFSRSLVRFFHSLPKVEWRKSSFSINFETFGDLCTCSFASYASRRPTRWLSHCWTARLVPLSLNLIVKVYSPSDIGHPLNAVTILHKE